ncbi:TPA: capsular polysaccharide synthesis protein [Streptococcus suis]|uniref:capsular polysaccharide synthesis protein n=1 Tax=Streptococcus suis TaxID=1307 RepID=UPI001ABE8583|nr:capsular polysaccharide synthesis protein [Streptococcus suis]MBO4109233.1 capsular polysaccharide synthesis protein [Streptococcus suis]HEM3667620.1 capsular polysaccharide synthesis protein [Streptococcus suis]HEM3721685.1 capsular polysaccharide synthesis protein [Streptococcus suis]
MINILKKVFKSGRIHQMFRNRQVFFSAIQLMIQPKTKKSLEILQISIDQKIMRKLRKKYKSDIEYFKANTNDFKFPVVSNEEIVWVLWFQGIENAPILVRRCFESLKQNIPQNKKLVALDANNLSEYINLPNFITEKYQAGKISHAHFSDIIRIELLSKYGGTWVDATVFMSSPIIHDYFFESDLFLFQELRPNTFGHSRRISNWFMTSKANNEIILLMSFLLQKYWEKHSHVIDYFIFHCFFEMAIEAYPEVWKEVIPHSNSHPHILQFRMFDNFNNQHWHEISSMIEVHKLTYKYEQKDYKGTYLDEIILQEHV